MQKSEMRLVKNS